jgi:hypothetical protein
MEHTQIILTECVSNHTHGRWPAGYKRTRGGTGEHANIDKSQPKVACMQGGRLPCSSPAAHRHTRGAHVAHTWIMRSSHVAHTWRTRGSCAAHTWLTRSAHAAYTQLTRGSFGLENSWKATLNCSRRWFRKMLPSNIQIQHPNPNPTSNIQHPTSKSKATSRAAHYSTRDTRNEIRETKSSHSSVQ